MLVLVAIATLLHAVADGNQLWVDPSSATALYAAVDEAALATEPLFIHLRGRFQLHLPLVLDARHSNTHFIGHGEVSISGAIEIGAVPPPPDGGKPVSGWRVVGTANCTGCTEIWRASVPKVNLSRVPL